MDGFADAQRIQFSVDVEGHDGLGVGGGSANACDTVIFGLIEGGDGEVLVEESGISCGSHGQGYASG